MKSRYFLLIMLIPFTLWAQEKKFNIYGFMDSQLERNIFDEQSMYKFIGLSNDWVFRVDHINLYLDFKPNDHNRVLTELRFLKEPHGTGSALGTILNPNPFTGNPDTTFPRPAVNNTIADASDGGYVTWGGVSVERAWFELLYREQLNFRVGKFITPAGIWNVDHGSPVILTVNQPYQTNFIPIFPKNQLGFMGLGMIFAGDIDIEYSVYTTTGRDDIVIKELWYPGLGGHITFNLPIMEKLQFGFSAFTGKQVEDTTWVTIDGTPDPDHDVGIEVFTDPSHKRFSSDVVVDSREICLGADLITELVKDFTIQAEFNIQFLENELKSSDNLSTTYGAYLLGSFNKTLSPNLKLKPYLMVELMKSKDAPNNPHLWFNGNTGQAGQSLDGFNVYVAGLNLNLYTNTTIKFEYAIIDANMVGFYSKYQDEFDMHTFATQFAIAF